MSDITVVGLGPMGAALAQALLKGGRRVTVWNRTASRVAPLVAAGAERSADAVGAVAASPVTILCVDSYATTRTLLDTPDGRAALAGRTIVQLSTGTPQEAREAEPWIQERGAAYVDGAIIAYPENIGTADALIVLAGASEIYERCKGELTHLAGHLRYLGPKIGAAAAFDFALLSRALGSIIGTLHAANICEAEGVGIDVLASMIPKGDAGRAAAKRIHSGDFARTGAPIKTWSKSIAIMRDYARDAGIGDEFPQFVLGMHERAIQQGLSEEDIAAIVKVLKAKDRT